MSETTNRPPLPDHLSIDPRSPHYAAAVFEHEVGIRFNGVERNDVDYTAVLTKIVKTENPDAIVYCSNFPTSIGLMVKQARQQADDENSKGGKA